jgi:GT2 family glycosyltransferase
METGGGACVSVVVVSHNEGEYLSRTVHSLLSAWPPDAELIVVDDQSTDGSAEGLTDRYEGVKVLRPSARLGVSGARNFGAREARGDVIVFSDAHVEVAAGWASHLLREVVRPEIGAVGPALSDMKNRAFKGYGLHWRRDAPLVWEWLTRQSLEPYPVPLLCGCFVALRRDVFFSAGAWDEGMIMYGMDDPELSIRLWTLGYECWVVPAVEVAHRIPDSSAYPEYQTNWEILLHNTLRLAVIHLGANRIRRVVEHRVRDSSFPAAFARLAVSDVWVRRSEIQNTRKYDDDWFFRRFPMD